MRREKRSARAVTYLHPSMYEQLELFAAESNVTTLSDYLFELVERHIAEREVQSIRVSKQRLGARAGRN